MEASVRKELCRHMCIHRYQGLSYANFRKHASNVAAPHDAAQDQSVRLVSHLPSVSKNLTYFPTWYRFGQPALPSSSSVSIHMMSATYIGAFTGKPFAKTRNSCLLQF